MFLDSQDSSNSLKVKTHSRLAKISPVSPHQPTAITMKEKGNSFRAVFYVSSISRRGQIMWFKVLDSHCSMPDRLHQFNESKSKTDPNLSTSTTIWVSEAPSDCLNHLDHNPLHLPWVKDLKKETWTKFSCKWFAIVVMDSPAELSLVMLNSKVAWWTIWMLKPSAQPTSVCRIVGAGQKFKRNKITIIHSIRGKSSVWMR